MDTTIRYYNTLKVFAFLVIVSLAWTNVISCVFDFDSCALELCDPIDGETEKEDTNEETEKDEKIQVDSDSFKYASHLISLVSSDSEAVLTYHHLEISTPPPEFIF